MAGQKPVAKFQAGTVTSAVWRNEAVVDGRKVVMLKASVERRYRNGSGEWQSSSSFSRNEIPLALYCLGKAFEHIVEKQGEEAPVGEEAVR